MYAPTGLYTIVGFARNPTMLGRFVNRPYGVTIYRLIYVKSDRIRVAEVRVSSGHL